MNNDKSQFGQSKELLKFINYENGVFIEAGANDGIIQSNTYYFEKELNWTGLLVEPNSFKFKECIQNRPNSICENYALVSSEYKNSTIKGSFSGPTNSLTGRVIDKKSEVFNRNILKEFFLHIKQREIIKVNCTTLTDLLIKNKIEKIDLLSLDVEEYELPILKGLDFELFRPKYLLIEIFPFEKSKQEMFNFLEDKKYNFIEKIDKCNDYIFRDSYLTT
tara:strand:- start:2664 stop:3323 length:660 start_codon:yes stop_codon:yes gene_type:complete